MKKYLLIGFAWVLFGLPGIAQAGEGHEVFSIYLVRHAEKAEESNEPGNPPLSFCGKLRSGAIAKILSDINLEKIYSTTYQRTMNTARPSAQLHRLDIDSYDPGDLESFSRMLIERRQEALVVGHSNTTPVLAGLLAGQSLEAFEEDIYDRLYQVVVSGGHARINLLHQSFYCEP
jgi:broad specificity phosphatase PhoE